MTTAYDFVRDTLVDRLCVDASNIALAAHFVDDLGLDSLDIVDLIQHVEEHLQIEIADSAMETLLTVNELVEFMESHQVVQPTST